MVYVMLREDEVLDVEPAVWFGAMSLARVYGWTPAGTVRDARWSGCYVVPAGQQLTEDDAAALSAALASALDDIPDHPCDVPRPNRLECLGGARKPSVQRLARFLDDGPVTIRGACAWHRRPGDAQR